MSLIYFAGQRGLVQCSLRGGPHPRNSVTINPSRFLKGLVCEKPRALPTWNGTKKYTFLCFCFILTDVAILCYNFMATHEP